MYTDQKINRGIHDDVIRILEDASRGIITFNQDFKDACAFAREAVRREQLSKYGLYYHPDTSIGTGEGRMP